MPTVQAFFCSRNWASLPLAEMDFGTTCADKVTLKTPRSAKAMAHTTRKRLRMTSPAGTHYLYFLCKIMLPELWRRWDPVVN